MELTDSRTGMESISESDCLKLLVAHMGEVGRLAVISDGVPHIVPMNYTVIGSSIVLRTDEGAKLHAAMQDASVAFEIDHVDIAARIGWSVVVLGTAEVVTSQTQIMLLRSNGLEPFAAGEKAHWVMIHPTRITGRRVPAVKRWFW